MAQLDDFEKGDFTPREKAALRFTEKFSYDHRAIDDNFLAAMREHFSEAELVELGQLVGVYLFRHRLNEVFGIL